MKKTIILAIALTTGFVSAAQKNLTIDQVYDRWQKCTMKCSDGTIIGLVKAFNSMLPTYSATEFLREAALPESKRNFIIDIDSHNGYASFAEGSDDASSESMTACVWRRNNGHRLFAIAFDQRSSKQQAFAAFYDFDPQKGTLSPNYDYLKYFKLSFPNSIFGIRLPKEGKDIVITEYFMNWWMGLRHIYKWDGNGLFWDRTEIDNIDTMSYQYRDTYYSDSKQPFEKYDLVDIDGDGEPELWLSSDNEESQAVYSICQGKITLLAGKDFKRYPFFYRNVAGDAGGCGTGCFYIQYNVMEKSMVKERLTNMQSYNMETDNLDDEFELNGKPLSKKQGNIRIKAFGKQVEHNPDWRPLVLAK